ncbi:DUF6559 family protein [Limnoglobus roseus]|uniref:Uncharacterized protein n=1 Tax=Limnoglobus roseus TaxID=2598579 RepID=A0A5C1A7I5_9BACT|nr:DUF6559 family protein [Limnoglobus roseus]QEL14177.1 hypothetical protein PX52LOC_01047 [Limnoglobus roseus]
MATAEPNDDSGVYGLAPEPPPAVSTAAACDSALTADKRRAVQTYLTTLGPALRDRYGRQPHYTPSQVRDTALDRALSIDYLCWAYVLHCSAPAFVSLHAAAGEACDYLAMRSAVGAAFFGGDARFATPMVLDAIVSGAAQAAATGTGGAIGWLGGVAWSELLDCT